MRQLTIAPRVIASGTAAVALALISGCLLGHTARWFADGMVVNAQLYFHAFRLAYVRSPWVLAPLRFFSAAVLQYSALAAWAFGCGYFCARAADRTRIWLIGMFTAMVLLGTAFTTTSGTLAQPRFFEGVISTSVYPLTVKLLFVVLPACFAAHTIRHRTTPASGIALIALAGIALTWWNVGDLGNALTFGCVLPGSGDDYCTSRESPWGIAGALILSLLAAVMAWECRTTLPPRRTARHV